MLIWPKLPPPPPPSSTKTSKAKARNSLKNKPNMTASERKVQLANYKRLRNKATQKFFVELVWGIDLLVGVIGTMMRLGLQVVEALVLLWWNMSFTGTYFYHWRKLNTYNNISMKNYFYQYRSEIYTDIENNKSNVIKARSLSRNKKNNCIYCARLGCFSIRLFHLVKISKNVLTNFKILNFRVIKIILKCKNLNLCWIC